MLFRSQLSIEQFLQIEALLKSSGHIASLLNDRSDLSGRKTVEDIAWLEADIGPSFGDEGYEISFIIGNILLRVTPSFLPNLA